MISVSDVRSLLSDDQAALISFGGGDDCWPFTGYLTDKGYGRLYINRRPIRAHRWVYTLVFGDPGALVVGHRCHDESDCDLRNRCPHRACVNPNHLSAMTQKENVRSGRMPSITGARQRSKTKCPHGHDYSQKNTYTDKRGRRICRACQRERSNAWKSLRPRSART